MQTTFIDCIISIDDFLACFTAINFITFLNLSIQAIIALAAVSSVIFAMISIRNSKKAKRVQLSIEELRINNGTDIPRKANRILSIFEDNTHPLNGDLLASNYFADEKKPELLEQAIDLIAYLNNLEHISTFIKYNVCDEKIIKMNLENRMVRTWKASMTFIQAYRMHTNNKEVWIHFEVLVQKWKKEKNT
jgi:hypothetical protein